MRFKKFFTIYEAISLAQAKKRNLSKKYGGAYRIDKAKELFGTKDRLVFDIDLDDADVIRKSNPLIGKINELLDQKFNGETRINSKKEYISGVIYDRKDVAKKQPKKIGRLLGKIGTPEAEELLKAFKVDPVRQTKGADGYSVVISRHPYDIAGMSTDRNWTSCMDLGTERLQYKGSHSNTGTYNRYVQADVSSGSLVAYLVSNTDRHKNGKLAVNKPLSRILLRPFINIEDPKDVVYGLGPMYGTQTQAFSDFIENWLKNDVNTNTKGKAYFKDTNVYSNDPDRPINFVISTRKNIRGETYFFDALNDDIDNSKYINNFIVDVRETNDDMRLKFEVIFNIPTTIKLEPFNYEAWEAIPTHLQPAIDFYDYQQRYIQGGFERIIGVIENNQQKIKTTFSYEQSYHLYEDDDGNEMPIDDYERDNQWQQFIESLNVNDIDYKDAYENIIKSLKAHDPIKTQQDDMDRIQEEFNALIDPNSPRLSPNAKELIKQVPKIKQEFHQVLTYLKSLSLGRPTPEQLWVLIQRSPEFTTNFEKYKELTEIIVTIYKNFRLYEPQQSKYPYINTSTIWRNLIDEFIGYDIKKIHDIKLRPPITQFVYQWSDFKNNHTPEEIKYMNDVYEKIRELRLY